MENPPASGLKRKEHVLSSVYVNHERIAVSSQGAANPKYFNLARHFANDLVSMGCHTGSQKCHHRHL
ncbi:hypothetical protein XSR1_290028 [Xenorhabdus szentirmaii DSM 16338]|uniref:Uncharacterized protein n=1 Tax=Xenorhabdus szentirmaii DSM 16338 TaxID=1427518 RepID=W1IZQ4_9GAMM|nr:hypothetical protein XSR1_290028 [Xenorhabdus szentirmaii DSM 16338]